MARRSDGSLVAWGLNTSGQCNVPSLPPGVTYVEIAAGGSHTVARRSDGSVVAWGLNASGHATCPLFLPDSLQRARGGVLPHRLAAERRVRRCVGRQRLWPVQHPRVPRRTGVRRGLGGIEPYGGALRVPGVSRVGRRRLRRNGNASPHVDRAEHRPGPHVDAFECYGERIRLHLRRRRSGDAAGARIRLRRLRGSRDGHSGLAVTTMRPVRGPGVHAFPFSTTPAWSATGSRCRRPSCRPWVRLASI